MKKKSTEQIVKEFDIEVARLCNRYSDACDAMTKFYEKASGEDPKYVFNNEEAKEFRKLMTDINECYTKVYPIINYFWLRNPAIIEVQETHQRLVEALKIKEIKNEMDINKN